jgi:hypothetical protein
MSNEILPCPDCGENEVYVYSRYRFESITGDQVDKEFWLECANCGYDNDGTFSLTDAISNWNETGKIEYLEEG